MAKSDIVVLGAGVVGLTTALQLSRNSAYNITVIAKHMPGDYDIEYTSPWAGADFLPIEKEGSLFAKFERDTWPELARLATSVPEAGIHFQPVRSYARIKDSDVSTADQLKESITKDAWYRNMMPEFRLLSKNELPLGYDAGEAYISVCLNTAIYLPWLAGQCLKNGVVLKRGIVSHISEAADLHHSGVRAKLVVNCTGLSACKLGGVEDKKVYPVRGQVVIVRNLSKYSTGVSGTEDGSEELMYTMNRAGGGGTVLGGCYQKNNWDPLPDLNLANRIIKRCIELCPELTGGKGPEALSIIRHAVGLRPMREGGPRVERDIVDGLKIVHNYGHGGYGYQSSYGTANMAMQLIEAALREEARL